MPEALSFPEIPLEKLRWRCDPDCLPFETTDELTPLQGILGQERAQRALTLGVEMGQAGYNIYVCGLTGTGRLTTVQRVLEAHRSSGEPPPDLCYVFRFQHPEQPRLLTLAAGQGRALKQAMESVLSDLKRDIPRALASDGFLQRAKARLQEAQRREEWLIRQLEDRLAPDFGLLWHHADPGPEPELAPIIDDQLTPLANLESHLGSGTFGVEPYRRIRARHAALLAECTDVFAEIRCLRHDAEEEIRTLERAHVRPRIEQRVRATAALFTNRAVHDYFREVSDALIEDSGRFHMPPPAEKEGHPGAYSAPPGYPAPLGYDDDLFHEYQVNIVVDNAETAGAPIILETTPTHKNLLGSIEPMMEYGGIWRSDFTGIRAGSLHRANGGYLIINALDTLADPIVWPVLKRALRYGQSEFQPHDHPGAMPGTGLKPDPVPCQVKVMMIGDEDLYDTLAREDENFTRLFKVKADFSPTIPRHADSIAQYADFLRRIGHEEQLRPCDRSAVAAIVEYGVRLSGRQNKLSARLEVIADVLREAHYWAGKAGCALVTREAVEQALRERVARVNMAEEEFHELIDEGILLITTHGAVAGQVNGLVVYETATDYGFGCPVRITASTTMGDAGVVNIEREADMSDATHHKGVLILTGYLRHAYAYDKPLVLSASLCVEQSYEGIAGDSASAAEMVAVLSSLASLPVAQGIAITGSVNQKGEIQPVSGVNEKIEGFFDVCRRQGLSGTQGAMIPAQNVADLMLRQDVIEAIAAGRFHLYAMTHIDEGVSILTGVPAGAWQPERGYAPESVNGRVDAQLRRFTGMALSQANSFLDEAVTPIA